MNLCGCEHEEKKIIDIGCGNRKLPGAVTVDGNPNVNPDILCDLDIYPYPIQSDKYDKVNCAHVIEHLQKPWLMMQELWRITKDGGIVLIEAPYVSGNNVCLVEHFKGLDCNSFNTFLCESWERNVSPKFYNGNARFYLHKIELYKDTYHWIDKIILKLINKYPHYYENRFKWIYPVNIIRYTLEVVK
jgi:ubiquinone/menaquinone biosynthesis C-methylase UbiE